MEKRGFSSLCASMRVPLVGIPNNYLLLGLRLFGSQRSWVTQIGDWVNQFQVGLGLIIQLDNYYPSLMLIIVINIYDDKHDKLDININACY